MPSILQLIACLQFFTTTNDTTRRIETEKAITNYFTMYADDDPVLASVLADARSGSLSDDDLQSLLEDFLP